MKRPTRRSARFRVRRGPNAELSALSLEVDLRALSLAEGARAALGTATLLALNLWLGWAGMNFVVLGALLTCLCDIGGAMGRRLVAIGSFVIVATLLFVLFGVARAQAPWVILPAACALLFLHAMARIWTQSAMQVGNLLSVVMILAIDRPADWHLAIVTGAGFAAGGLYALLLTLLLWRIKPYQPGRRAVGAVYRQLAALADDLRLLAVDPDPAPQSWDDHARAHRRSVRDAIEVARGVVREILRTRGPGAGRAVQSPIRLEAADRIFGAMIGLSSVMESDPATRAPAARLLRLLPPLLRSLAQTVEREEENPGSAKVARGIAAVRSAGAETPALRAVLEALAERLALAASVTGPTERDMDPADSKRIAHAMLGDARDRIGAELRWGSAILRHAVRTALLGGFAIAMSLLTRQYYLHWLSIAVVVTLQPFFADTQKRAFERILGTSAGVLGVTLLALVVRTPGAITATLVPVTVVAFALRQVSLTLFISGLTPFVILLVELGHAGAGAGGIALQRMVYTLAGGLLAVAGNRVLWPIWEPVRVRDALAASLRTHAAWVRAEKSDDQARRAAGRCSNQLETTLGRALAEPGQHRDPLLVRALVADAALRRIGGHLIAVAMATRCLPPDSGWRGWIAQALEVLAAGDPALPERPAASIPGPLQPIVGQVDLIAGAYKVPSA